jgi:hypothetical protein
VVVLHASGRDFSAAYPNDALLAGFPLRLWLQDGDTVMVGEVPGDQGSVAPTEFGEQAKNPVFGGVLAVRDVSRGMGQRRLRGNPTGRLWYTLNARSRPGYLCKGPGLTTYTPGTVDATVGITRFYKINGRIRALNGRYALDGGADGTGWTVSKDFGVGKAAVDVLVLQTNQAGSTRYAYVAMGDAEDVWYEDGAGATTTWTQTAGANAFKARAWAADTTTVYYVNDANKLNTCSIDADLLVVANHAAPTQRIGGKDMPVTRLKINGSGSLLAAKQDDIHSLQQDGSWNRMFEERQFVPSATNGEVFFRWGNESYVVYGNKFHRLSDDGGLTQCGPEMLRDNGSPVKGYISAGAGTDYFALCGIYDPDTGDSHVMEFTGELTEGPHGFTEPVWHGSVTPTFADKKITAIGIDTAGAPGGHKMAYLGFSDGSIVKYVLACTVDPCDCAQEAFSTADGYAFYPRLLFHFPGQLKAMLSATGEADNFGGANYAQLAYRTTGNTDYIGIGTDFNQGDRHRVVFPDALAGTYLDARVTLVSSDGSSSPRVTGFSFDWQLRTQPQEVISVLVRAENGLRQLDGTPYRHGAKTIRDRIEALAGFAGGITYVDPNGDSHQVTMLTPQRRVVRERATGQTHDAIQVVLVERKPNEHYGPLNNLAGLTLRQMSAYTLRQLSEIGQVA